MISHSKPSCSGDANLKLEYVTLDSLVLVAVGQGSFWFSFIQHNLQLEHVSFQPRLWAVVRLQVVCVVYFEVIMF